jgi:hypothetical protein
MLREALIYIPQSIADRPAAMLLTVAGTGAMLALSGARFSRAIVTLAAVGAGAFLGLHLPAWMGWKLDPIGGAFCGAIVLGLSGFVLHRAWMGILLASLLSSYCGAITWILRGGPTWKLPQWDGAQDSVANLQALWRSLPANLYPSLPIALFAGLAAGLIAAIYLPRFTRVAFFTLLGGGALMIAGGLSLQKQWPQRYEELTSDLPLELSAILIFVLLSMAIQWLLLPRVGKVGAAASENSGDDNVDDAENDEVSPPGFATSAFPIDQKRQETANRRQRMTASQS